jgi:glycosyltransferase involved in cell wall biosynthesis
MRSMGTEGYLPTLTRPLRVLVVSQPLAEGVPRHVSEFVRSLDHAEYEIDVACPRTSTLWKDLQDRRGVNLHELAPTRLPSPADAASLVRLMRLARRVDVIHAHSSKAGLLARLVALLARRVDACIFTPHAWSFWAARGLEARLYGAFECLAARWCRTIVVVSEDERSAGLAAGIGKPAQYRVIPNGVDPEQFSADREPVPGRIVMIGRLARQKRPDLAVRAFVDVRRRYPAAELHFVGEGPLRSDVETLVSELGLAGAVKFLGVRSDVPALLARADCLLLSSDYEGCPFSVLEAMAAGVPVVATRVGGVAELVAEETGLLVEPGRPDLLAAAVAELFADPARARALGEAGRERVRQRYSSQKMTEALVALYREVAGASTASSAPEPRRRSA